jgi:hypothetical protein
MTDPAGTLKKALERNLLNVKHDYPLSRLWRDWTSLLVKFSVTHPNPIKPAFQVVGSVPGGSAQSNDEVKYQVKALNLGLVM